MHQLHGLISAAVEVGALVIGALLLVGLASGGRGRRSQRVRIRGGGRRGLLGWVVVMLSKSLLVAARFAIGAPLSGKPRTDATLFSAGENPLASSRPWWGSREPTRWAYAPGWQRALVRWGAVGAVGAWFAWPTQTRWALALVAAILLGTWGARAYHAIRLWEHTRRYLRPLHLALSGLVGISADQRPDEWLHVPVDFQREDAVIEVDLPAEFSGAADLRRVVTSVVTSKLGLSESALDASFHMVGDPFVQFKHAPRPPDEVTVDMVRETLLKAPASAPIIGLSRRDKKISSDLDTESPHVLVSMGTGAGKSMLCRGLAAQQLRHGSRVIILDVKRSSQRWARGLPGVTYCRDAEDIHNMLLWLADECDRRNAILDEQGDDADAGPRTVIVAEEMNATIKKLQRYWDQIREKSDRKASPAVEALGDVLFMGRAGKIHVIGVAQLATARALGGPEMRENFWTRILGRYTQNAWKMLVPEVWPMPQASRHRGRVQVVIAGEAFETQVIYWTEEEARAWATSGAATPEAVPVSQGPTHSTPQGKQAGTVPDEASADRPELRVVRDPEEELVGLSEAIQKGIVTVSDSPKKALEILRSARKRDPEFPESMGQRRTELLYRAGDLARWQRNRPNNPATDDDEKFAQVGSKGEPS